MLNCLEYINYNGQLFIKFPRENDDYTSRTTGAKHINNLDIENDAGEPTSFSFI
jgi:hypothetical protein